jgi:hypothetical protein
VVCHYLRPKIVWIVWFQFVILSIMALFTIVTWDRSSYMDLLMFYSLACLSFFRYRSHGFRSLSMYFPIDYYRFRNYRNIDVVFAFDNIVSISFSRKRRENKSNLTSYRSFPIVFILGSTSVRTWRGSPASPQESAEFVDVRGSGPRGRKTARGTWSRHMRGRVHAGYILHKIFVYLNPKRINILIVSYWMINFQKLAFFLPQDRMWKIIKYMFVH